MTRIIAVVLIALSQSGCVAMAVGAVGGYLATKELDKSREQSATEALCESGDQAACERLRAGEQAWKEPQ